MSTSPRRGAGGGRRTHSFLLTGQALFLLSFTGVGGPGGSRTHFLLLAGQALSQLSFRPVAAAPTGLEPASSCSTGTQLVLFALGAKGPRGRGPPPLLAVGGKETARAGPLTGRAWVGGLGGLEPPCPGSQPGASTLRLQPQSGWRGLNSRSPPWQGGVLPDCTTAAKSGRGESNPPHELGKLGPSR